MECIPSRVPGCVELRSPVHADSRGQFVKPFHASTFEALGLSASWQEIFFSASSRGVVRGLHFQTPPAAQAKLVCCVAGEVLDVVVDVRAGSPTFGASATFHLSGEGMRSVYVPVGCAHGFATLTDGAVVAYAVTSEYDPECDSGLRWDSVAGLRWPFDAPTVSERDASLPRFEEFETPFVFGAADA